MKETTSIAEVDDCLAIIEQIQNYFAAKGWQPLLQVKVNGLKTLSHEKLDALLPLVLAAPDRMDAVTAILEAVSPVDASQVAARPDSSDWDILQLRPDERRTDP